MKILFENWRTHIRHLKTHPYQEPHGLQEEEQERVVTFDFDDTLSLSHFDTEDDDWVHDGPHLPMINRFKRYQKAGYKVFIVTSRHEKFEDNAKNNPKQKSVAEFASEYNLNPAGIHFVNGTLKTSLLKTLNSLVHHDDDLEEIEAAKNVGIKTVISEPYKTKNLNIKESHEPEDTHKVSKVIIKDDDGYILILQRAEGNNNWDLPGGHIQEGESAQEGCKREAREETNLNLPLLSPSSKHRNVTFYTANKPKGKGKIKLQSDEHRNYKWIKPQDISKFTMRSHIQMAIKDALGINEEESFQQDVKRGYRKMKVKLIASGPNKYNVGGKMQKPSYKRSKSAPVGFGGSLEETK